MQAGRILLLEMKSNLRIQITVRGRLSRRLAGAFDGMALVPRTGATEIAGEVVDHAQLHGLLTRVRDLGLELQSVMVFDAAADGTRARSVVGRASRHENPDARHQTSLVSNKTNKLQGGLS